MGKHKLLKFAATSAAALYGINTFIDKAASDKNMINDNHGYYFTWKQGDIFYTKNGQGEPLLLIHNLDNTSSTYEWSKIIKKLEKHYTVYSLDLLGCGQSDKPNITYTNYLYVQLITDFIKEIIKNKTNVITSATSASFVVMANNIDASLFDKIIMINPNDLKETSLKPSQLNVAMKYTLYLPLIGTALYNYFMQEDNIKKLFQKEFFSNHSYENNQLIDTYYQAAHIHKSNGRFLYACKKCCYLNVNMEHALQNKSNINIIASTERNKSMKIVDKYTAINSNIEVTYISNSKLLPQLELPEKTLEIIFDYLEV